MSDLPVGWTETTLGEINTYVSKSINPLKFENETFELYSVPSFPSNAPEILKGNSIGSSKQVVEPNDVLVCKINPRINRVWLVKPANKYKQIASSEWIIVRVPECDSGYLRYYFASPAIRDRIVLDVTGVGGSLTRAQPKRVAKFPVPIAPLNEQKRIAETLDSLLARVDSCQSHLERVPQILKRFRQSVLAAATSGRLTEDWRDERAVNGEWEETDVQSVAFVGTGSTPLRSNSSFYSSKGTPWVTSAATGQPFIHEAKEFVTKEAIKEHRLKLYPIGTVIVAMYGEGKTRGQVSELAIEATINQACAAIVVDEAKVAKKYLKLALQANYLEMRELAEGGNQPNLNLSKIKEFIFPLPSPEEQAEIVKRIEKLFATAETLEARYLSASEHVERLRPSLLAKAFRGELVEQNPNDEPMSILLEKIQDARNAQPVVSKRSIKSKETRMYKMKETLEEIIQDLSKDSFSFEDLQEKFSGDYEELKEELFRLLSAEEPLISQIFDKSSQSMRFVRRKK